MTVQASPSKPALRPAFAALLLATLIAGALAGAASLWQARTEARAALAEARALYHWVADEVVALPVDASGTAPRPDPIGLAALERSLDAAKLEAPAHELAELADGRLRLSLRDAEFGLVTAWLAGTAPDWGYTVTEFTFVATGPATVNASFVLDPQP